jgi:RNA polymerase sigma factor (sigma-70 family)
LSLTNQNILILVDGCRHNHRESQQELYKLLYDYAYGISYRYSNDEQEANALVNDSFLKLFTHIDVCKLDKSTNMLNSFKGWFKKIIVNTCIDRYRSTRNSRQHEVDTPAGIVDQSENGEDKLGYKEIINSVKQLSIAYRTVFNLHVIEGFSHEEIAGMLDISVGTSKSNLSKAKERLRAILQNKTNYNITYDASTGQRQ